MAYFALLIGLALAVAGLRLLASTARQEHDAREALEARLERLTELAEDVAVAAEEVLARIEAERRSLAAPPAVAVSSGEDSTARAGLVPPADSAPGATSDLRPSEEGRPRPKDLHAEARRLLSQGVPPAEVARRTGLASGEVSLMARLDDWRRRRA